MSLRTIPFIVSAAALLAFLIAPPAEAQITVLNSFNPTEAGGLCGLGYDQTAGNVWVYDCSAATIQNFAPDGTFLGSVPRPGESANDVDVEFAPEAMTLAGAAAIPAGTLLFINGESGPAEVYAVDKTSGAVIATLNSQFGASHVVGGGYSTTRDAFFLVQDNVPGPADENRVAEVDPDSGWVLSTFQTTGTFSVNFGDLDVSTVTGNLFIVSSIQSSIAEYTPDGTLVTTHPLPAGVGNLSGIGLNCPAREAWVADTGGTIWRLGDVPCGPAAPSLSVTATSPLTAPPGGQFSFDYTVTNPTASSVTGDLYYVVRRNGSPVAQAIVQSGTLPAGQSLSASTTLNVPVSAPAGSYDITFSIGSAFGTAVDSETITVTVSSGPAARTGASDWSIAYASPWSTAEPHTASARSFATTEAVSASPNPFVARTTLRYELEEASRVRLALYDIMGREVAVLADGFAGAGPHTATFEADGLAPGVYVWRLVAGGRVETGRITLAR